MSFREARRFPRVQIVRSLAGHYSGLQAQVTWPNHEISEVIDLSYKGLAARRPGLFPLSPTMQLSIDLALGIGPAFRVQVRVAWGNADWTGLEFQSLPPEGHQSMRAFLEAKLVGLGMKPVESVFVSRDQDFKFWYQGSDRTQVYVWMPDPHQIDRVIIERDGSTVAFHRGQATPKLTSDERRAILVLSQMDKPGLPMEEFVRSLFRGA